LPPDTASTAKISRRGTPIAMNQSLKDQIAQCSAMLKGRTAEALVEELFKAIGYSVHRYGIENSLPSILHQLGQFRNSPIIEKVRSLPDFIVTKNDSTAYEIEVKYRENSRFGIAELLEKYPEYPHVSALFVVVSPKSIKCISYAELKEGKRISPRRGAFLGDRPEFSEHRELIAYFVGFVKRIYGEGLSCKPKYVLPDHEPTEFL
jgi:hypothetical protein